MKPKKPHGIVSESVPSKEIRAAEFRASVERRGLSPEAAVEEARLIPKEMAQQFKVLWWPR